MTTSTQLNYLKAKSFKKKNWTPFNIHLFQLTSSEACATDERQEFLCDKLSNSILPNPSHKLYSLLPPTNEREVNLRSQHSFTTRRLHTIRTRNSFIYHSVLKAMM